MAHVVKHITAVPSYKDFVDIVLSRTQRKTPTVIHKHYKISRIREFYMRKVKFTQQTFHDKLSLIISEFPLISNLHPFYATLMNVLYNTDHYKLALGGINKARQLIDDCAKDHVKLLKYGDSLYRCKCLKRAALGRMVTIMKGQSKNLQYLEEIRQHINRLPTIDPNTRTLLITGFPNVGKSSFINKISRADVEVQPYAFTTKSLYVGHTDYKYLRWQVLDTPGILDHPIEERNAIEMQAVAALIHIRAVVLYIADVSEQCGHSLEEQLALYKNIKPSFSNRPIVIVLNKIDVVRPDELSEEKKKILDEFRAEGEPVLEMSTMTEEGVMDVKTTACEKLLAFRVEQKMKSNKIGSITNRLHVAVPKKRDDKERPVCIPEAVLKKKKAMDVDGANRKLERDIEMEMGDDYTLDLRKTWLLQNEDEKYDVIPEIWQGRNVADFIDPDIMKKLEELEKEEEAREEAHYYSESESDEDEEMKEIRKTAKKIREKRTIITIESGEKRRVEKSRMPRSKKRTRSVAQLENELEELGVEIPRNSESHYGRAKSKSRSASRPPLKKKRDESVGSVTRSKSRTPRDKSGLRDNTMIRKVKKIAKKAQKPFNHQAKKGEGDRVILNMKPKHLFSGKRKAGKTDRR
ncbi:nucleolar GTP-binding protein 1 [Biomphalaria glabrata]|uniref:Nucleolar GTP-binding protein 1 n=1 Tax=Biomphalaria glabrata TaxID=6526 RepID=A0A9U8EAJ0_BIOGL|nr:GTP-binding protein 4-like [Biomphalaria glabrata]KAI8743454.1 nucleolar GTP-binding protein 1-like [Biomphalaria glabrata]